MDRWRMTMKEPVEMEMEPDGREEEQNVVTTE